MAYVDIRIHFAEELDIDEEYVHYDPVSVERLATNIPEDSFLGIQESLAQSDFGTIGFPNGLIDVLDGTPTKFDKRL